MGALGTSIQTTVNNIVDNVNFRTPVIVTSRSPTEGSYGGFDGVNDNAGIDETVNAVPYDLIQPNVNLGNFGQLGGGQVRMVFRGDSSLDKHTEVTFNGSKWEVIQIEPVIFNEELVAQVVTFSPIKE